jgi:Na+-translocating ferredoxin:NAD+ oxidoreductase RnfG subunit
MRVFSLFAAFFFVSFQVHAEVYLSQDQALDVVFGKECVRTYDPKEISSDLAEKLDDKGLLAEPEGKKAHFFVCKNKEGAVTNYALIDAEVGKHLPITYIVGISPKGEVTKVEMMVFREVRGWEVRERSFMRQFEGKKEDDDLRIGRGISNISGATLSARAMAKGVERALFLWRYFYGEGES